MNDRSIIDPSEPDGRGTWLETYLPEHQMVPAEPRQQLISLATVRGILFRQRWLLVGVILSALTVGLIMTLLSTPMYQATAKVSVEPYGAFILEGQDVEQGIASNQVGEFLATQVELIKSRSIAEVVVKERNLGERYDLLGQDIDQRRSPDMTDEQWLEAKEAIATSILVRGVTSEIPATSWVIPIGFRSDNPTLAAEMANAYADAFISSETRETIEGNEYAIEYLRDQIEIVRGRLEEAERSANTYARNTGIVVQPVTSADGLTQSNSTLTNVNLASINQRFADARAARIAAEQKWRSMEGLPAAQLPEVQNNPVLQGLITNRTGKLAELAELRQRYSDEFPQIQNLIAQIEILDAQIERSSADIKSTVRNAYIVARNQEQALQAELGSLSSSSMAEQDEMVQLGALEREANALREQLQSLLARFNQISSAATANSGTMTKIESALVPGRPYAPSLIQNLGLSLVLGIGLAAGLAVLREMFDDRVRSLDEVEQKIDLPLIGHTPHVDERDIDSESSNNFTSLMEAYASIKAAIEFSLPRSRNVLQLTSTHESEGKSTTAVVLAELFARSGRRTLLIDADLRRPSVATLLELERPKVGLVEVLMGHATLEETVVKGVHDNLEVLPIGAIPPNPAEILSSDEMVQFIEKVRHEYSLVLFDSCPVLGLADAPTLARNVDGTIFVLEANKVPFAQARNAVKRLRSAGANVLGLILTKYRALEAGQGYGYQYNYYEYGSDK
ncbi:exopolysaccharide biosynthesis protein [Erythrobacter sp. KY5]|uniref:GumC family protein n=1 Tax=Erythrobacter sp. KY5 TaxID=2011159 RepID=UPI000DBF2D93|nr:polysaccharide biosynthesis tyrosine autokinase [Erythrobacter sp. KY5]AWW72901.1 exopolysaccharide biosynthesis protein [Erythrobacter sp. KY5]